MEKEKIIKLRHGIPVTTNTSVFNSEGLNLDELFVARDKILNGINYGLLTKITTIQNKLDKIPTNVITQNTIEAEVKKILNVNSTDDVQLNDPKLITSGGVYREIGNIEELLKTL